MTYGSLFAGVGGFDIGFDRAGFKCAWRVEWEHKCIDVLHKLPHCPTYGDITRVKHTNLEPVDVVLGGFPCTDLSVCAKGSHEGLEGQYSGLVHEYARIVQGLQPKIFVVENVPRLLKVWDSVMKMGYFDGYTTYGEILDAQDFGAYTRRKRAFIVGHLGARSPRAILDFSAVYRQVARVGRGKDVLPMCLPCKGGVSLERLGACLVVPN